MSEFLGVRIGRSAAVVASALAVTIALAGCEITTTPGPPRIEATGGIATAVPVPKATAIPVACPDGKADLSKSNGLYALAKECVVVTITGSSDQVTAKDVTKLTIKGFFNTVSAGSIGTVSIAGDSNTVHASHIGVTRAKGTYNQVGTGD